MSISMYFGVSWLDPRLNINDSATEWTEVKTGPKDVSYIFRARKFKKVQPKKLVKSNKSISRNYF